MVDRPDSPACLAITFFYYRDLKGAVQFYENVLGLRLAIDQGWSKIYRLCDGAHVGLVDETKGINRSSVHKPVQLCIRVNDVQAWYEYMQYSRVNNLSDLFQNDQLGIQAFVFRDPEGYQIEIQSAIREGA